MLNSSDRTNLNIKMYLNRQQETTVCVMLNAIVRNRLTSMTIVRLRSGPLYLTNC